jgi:DNA polymerase-3 subunit gamma/tau
VNEVLGLVSREVFFALGERILGRDPEGALAALHAAYRDGGEPRDLAEGLLDHLRSILVLRVDPAAEDLLAATPGERERFTAQGSGHDTPDLLRHMRIASEALGAMRDSAQPLTHLEAAVVEMASLEPGMRLADILERLGALEGKEAPGGGKRGLPAPATVPSARPGARPAGRSAPATPRATPPASAPGLPGRERAPELPYRKGLDVYGPDPHLASEQVRVVGGPARVPVACPEPPIALAEPARAEPAAAATAASAAAPWDRPGAWDEVVARVKDRKLMVGVFLAESRRAGWEGATLCLAADEVHKSLLEARENRELLFEILKSVYGRPVQLRFVERSAVPPVARAETLEAAVGIATAVETEIAIETATADATALESADGVGPAASAPDRDVTSPSEAKGSPAKPREVNGSPATERARAPAPGSSLARGVAAGESSEAEAALSPEVREAMVWFEGEIIRRPDPGGTVP